MKRFLIISLLLASNVLAQEETFIKVLQSDAPLKDKADACRELVRVGTKQAVPVLAPLLADEKLSHWARYALEPIADPSVDAALRGALGQVRGRLLAGVIDSLGVRKDRDAINALAPFMSDADPLVAQTTARALGNIGGPALPALESALATSPANRSAICEGLLRCAETVSAPEAMAVYDRIRRLPRLPHHVQVAALRGAILSRGAQGLALVIEAIQDESSALQVDAMGISADIPGQAMTAALTRQLNGLSGVNRLLLVETLGNRGDASATPALVPLAQAGPTQVRIAAMRSLAQLSSPPAIPVLLASIKDTDAGVSKAAQDGLVGFPTQEADAAVVALLSKPDKTTRLAAIEMVTQRRSPAAVPPLLQATGDRDTRVTRASFKALGKLAGAAEIPAIVDAMVKTQAVPAAEAALAAICTRESDKTRCSVQLLPCLPKTQGVPKQALLRVLRTIGNTQTLAAVRAATQDRDPAVKETAQRVLCDWPTADALPDLAQLAQKSTEARFQILALRGQLRLIPLQTVPDRQKLAQLKEVLPLIKRTEEQRLLLATLGGLPSVESLGLVVPYLSQASLREEASVAAVGIAEKIAARHPAEVAEAMKQVETKNKALAGRVRKLLASLPRVKAGFKSIFNGKDLTGWDAKPGWWTVEDGALTSESTPDKPCPKCNYLIWRGGQPADFELRADFRLSGQGNSGIQIRSETRPDWDTYGYQADMTGDGELIGFVYHHKYGLIAGRGEKAVFAADGKPSKEKIGDPADLLKHYKPGEWNTYRIICRGPDITLDINGTRMCQITDQRVPAAARRGIIALQMHPGPPMKVQFKNLRIKVLE